MNLDAHILSLARQGPGAVSLHHLCTLLFPTFCWQEMSPIARLIRWRCQELAGAGYLCEMEPDVYAYRRRRVCPGCFYARPLSVC